MLIAIFVAAWAWFKTPLAFFRPADDAYYYFDVASHVVHHGTFSTDGLHATNGFHPLWIVVLMPFAAVFEAPSQGLVVSAQLISCLCTGFAVAGIAATARRGGLAPFAAALGALALFAPDWRGIVGAIVEGGLTLALLSWTAFAALRLRDRLEEGIAGTRDGVLVGLLAGFAVLARLDAVWTVGAVCLLVSFWISRSRNSKSITRPLALAVLGIPAAILGVYIVANVAATGHVVPISGQIKSSFPAVDFSSTYLRQYKMELLLLAVAAVALVVARLQSSRLFGLLLALTVGGAVQVAYVLLFVPRGVFWWYFVTLLPAGLLGLAVLIDAVVTKPWVRERPALLVAVRVAAALALLGPIGITLREKSFDGKYLADSGWRVESQRAGEWAGKHLPSGAVLAMVDSGAFGYYAPQEVMNLDGVISSYAFHDAVCAGNALQEMRRAGVRYVATHAADPSARITVKHIPCWADGPATTLTFRREDTVYRSAPYVHGGREVVFAIWRFPNRT